MLGQLGCEIAGVVQRLERLEHSTGVNRHGSVAAIFFVDEVSDEAFDVAVEDQSDEFSGAVDDR